MLLVLALVGLHRRFEVGVNGLVLSFLLILPILVVRLGELILHLLVFGFLLLLKGLLLLLLHLLPLLVVCSSGPRAEDRKRTVGITTRALDHQSPVRVPDAPLVNRVVVAATADLIPGTIFAAVNVSAIRYDTRAAKNDVADAVRRTRVRTISALPRDDTGAYG